MHLLISEELLLSPGSSIVDCCEAGGVSRSWYYQKKSEGSASLEARTLLRHQIEQITLEFRGYGYRRVTAHLHREGIMVNHKRVLRIMQEECLLCELHRRFLPTTNSSHNRKVYPNLLKGRVFERVNEVWVSDITYIRLPEGFCFLAVVLDAYSRKCVGFALSARIDTKLTLLALDRAISSRDPGLGLLHHSDRGVQYASGEYVSRLSEIGACVSMSGAGNPYENARAESFMKTLKTEEVHIKTYRNLQEAQSEVSSFIGEVYNKKRLHSSLGYLPPCEYEALKRNVTLEEEGVL